MASRTLQPPFRRTVLAPALRQVLQQRRLQALVAAGLVGLAPVSLAGPNGFKLSGVAAQDHSVWSVSNAGDVNGDGVDDVLIGAPAADSNGASYVVFGEGVPGDADGDGVADGADNCRLAPKPRPGGWRRGWARGCLRQRGELPGPWRRSWVAALMMF